MVLQSRFVRLFTELLCRRRLSFSCLSGCLLLLEHLIGVLSGSLGREPQLLLTLCLLLGCQGGGLGLPQSLNRKLMGLLGLSCLLLGKCTRILIFMGK